MFIYLHGFNSAYNSSSDKVRILAEHNNIMGITYDTFESRLMILNKLKLACSAIKDKVFIGTSLGGYYAAALAEYYGVPSILLNPSINPYEDLKANAGLPYTNYLTGEVKSLSNITVDSYFKQNMNLNGNAYEYVPFVAVNRDDEVIDQSNAVNTFKDFLLDIRSGGTHRYDHMKDLLPKIIDYTNTCEFIADIDT